MGELMQSGLGVGGELGHGGEWLGAALRTDGFEIGRKRSITAGGFQGGMKRAQEQSAIASEADHLKALRDAGGQINGARAHNSAVFTGMAEGVFDSQELFGNAGSFPLAAEASGGRVIRGAEEKDFGTWDLGKGFDIPAGGDGFDDGDDEGMIIGLLGVLEEALAPGGGSLGPNPANALWRVQSERNGLLQLLRGFDPWDNNAVGA